MCHDIIIIPPGWKYTWIACTQHSHRLCTDSAWAGNAVWIPSSVFARTFLLKVVWPTPDRPDLVLPTFGALLTIKLLLLLYQVFYLITNNLSLHCTSMNSFSAVFLTSCLYMANVILSSSDSPFWIFTVRCIENLMIILFAISQISDNHPVYPLRFTTNCWWLTGKR